MPDIRFNQNANDKNRHLLLSKKMAAYLCSKLKLPYLTICMIVLVAQLNSGTRLTQVRKVLLIVYACAYIIFIYHIIYA